MFLGNYSTNFWKTLLMLRKLPIRLALHRKTRLALLRAIERKTGETIILDLIPIDLLDKDMVGVGHIRWLSARNGLASLWMRERTAILARDSKRFVTGRGPVDTVAFVALKADRLVELHRSGRPLAVLDGGHTVTSNG